MFVLPSVVGLVLTTTLASVSVFAPSAPVNGQKPANTTVQSTSAPATFATLRGVSAVPLASAEMGTVKGAHAHFVTLKSQNELFGITGFHVVNRNNLDNWLDLGNGEIVGPGYHGLCGAALNSPNMFIPGQNPVTGVGGGC